MTGAYTETREEQSLIVSEHYRRNQAASLISFSVYVTLLLSFRCSRRAQSIYIAPIFLYGLKYASLLPDPFPRGWEEFPKLPPSSASPAMEKPPSEIRSSSDVQYIAGAKNVELFPMCL